MSGFSEAVIAMTSGLGRVLPINQSSSDSFLYCRCIGVNEPQCEIFSEWVTCCCFSFNSKVWFPGTMRTQSKVSFAVRFLCLIRNVSKFPLFFEVAVGCHTKRIDVWIRHFQFLRFF